MALLGLLEVECTVAPPPASQAVNPNGKIPAVRDSSGATPVTVWESGAIMFHFLGLAKDSTLLPAGGEARSTVLAWVFLQQTALAPAAVNLYKFLMSKQQTADDFGPKRFGEELHRVLTLVEERLAVSAYLGGEEYTLADVASYHWVAALLNDWPGFFPAAFQGAGISAGAFPATAAWVAKVATRPAVVAADAGFATEAFKALQG